jgi:hypothetical protein
MAALLGLSAQEHARSVEEKRVGETVVGQVVDAATGRPIASATVTSGGDAVQTDAQGMFRLQLGDPLRVRAPGYGRRVVPAASLAPIIALERFSPKAIYLSVFGVGTAALRDAALRLIEEAELNAIVIDVKGDRGIIPYRSAVPLATEVGAQDSITIKDISALLADLRRKGIYTIARIVVFKDDLLARRRPQLAVKDRSGGVWRDHEQLAWTDPFQPEVWDYSLAIAVEAARHGFDEIQFDYVRFPDAPGLAYAQPSTEDSRVRVIEGFLAKARRSLAPHNVFVAADVFGYICWNQGDTGIGQRLETLVAHLDYVSPMLYPSSFQFGIPGYRNPVAHPSEVVALSLARAAQRTGLPAVRFRPWLQAFPDYAFDRRPFRAVEIRAQIVAAEAFGANGWMLWNPHNVYSGDGLKAGAARGHHGPSRVLVRLLPHELGDLIQAGLDVRLPDPDQWLEVLRQKHQEAQQRRPRRFTGTQAARQESKAPRQTRLAIRGEPGQVLRRAEDQEIHRAQVSPILPRQHREQPVQALEHQRIVVDEVEEDRVQEDPGYLGRRRIAVNGRSVGLLVGWPIAGRDCEDPAGAEVNCGR